MKFNKQTNEKQRLLDLIKKSHQNKTLELEAILHYQKSQKAIQYEDFLACLKRIKNQKEFKAYPAMELININFKSDSKYKNVRITISGKEMIKYFCSNGKVKELGSNVKYMHKELVSTEGRIARVDIEDYNIRFNLKEEKPLDEGNELIRDLLDHWNEVPKFFRYKKTFTFETSDGLFRNDFSIVKESKDEIREMSIGDVRRFNLEDLVVKPDNIKNFNEWWNKIKNQSKSTVKVDKQPVYYQSFAKSGTLENKPFYDIEVEYLGNQKGQKTLNDTDVMVKYIELIGIHLQAIQKSYFIIGLSEINLLRNDLQALTGVRGKNMFKAPLPVTAEITHFQKLTNRQYLDPSNYNLRKNFLVTEKMDGDRQLLFVNSSGHLYFINRGNAVRKLGIKMPELASSLIDGEFLDEQNLYMIFDVYFFQGQPIWKEVFKPRYDTMKKIASYLKTNVDKPGENVEVQNQMLFGHKVFYSGDTTFNKTDLDGSSNDSLLFDACKRILNQVNVNQGGLLDVGHQFSYNIDGLIFVPSNLHVGQDYPEHIVKSFSDSANWLRTYKWKSPIHNSIDFVIEVFHQPGKVSTNDQYKNGILYRQVSLKTNYQSDFHFQYDAQRTLNEGTGNFAGTKLFTPNYPFVGSLDFNNNLVEESYIAWIPLDKNSNMITLEGNLVQDGDTVEFTYDLTEEDIEFRWKAMRDRPGKGANNYHSAINIWRSINIPITTKMIVGDVDIPEADTYYQSNVVREELYTTEMNKFHNFVKSRLYEHVGKERKNPAILELGSGKFGDYFKWITLNPSFVLGVEYAQDNINNFINGAAVRALKAEENNPKIKKLNNNIITVWGDCSKSINNGDSAMDDLNKYYLKVLYGDADVGDYSKLGKLSGKCLNKFDIVSCQFAIHYFFEDFNKLNGFLTNVYQNLKTGGFFIGTCLDGNLINKKFHSKDTNIIEYYQDDNKEKLIWRIKKNYEVDTQLTDDEKSIGLKISVDFESINKTSNEFLVNFNYLVKIMNEYGMELVDSRLFTENQHSMLDEFYSENKVLAPKLRAKPKVLEYSSLSRWFIFVKKGISDEESHLTNEEEKEITSINFNKNKDKDTDTDTDKQSDSEAESDNEDDIKKKKHQKGGSDDIEIKELDFDDIKMEV